MILQKPAVMQMHVKNYQSHLQQINSAEMEKLLAQLMVKVVFQVETHVLIKLQKYHVFGI